MLGATVFVDQGKQVMKSDIRRAEEQDFEHAVSDSSFDSSSQSNSMSENEVQLGHDERKNVAKHPSVQFDES